VTGWLVTGWASPINALSFWSAMVGTQLALLGLWCIAALPGAWLGGLPRTLGALGAALPALVARALLRVDADALSRALDELRRLDWLYARLRLWLVTALTQAFGIGFNLGALTAMVAIGAATRLNFVWGSTLLSESCQSAIIEAAALPWSAWLPEVHTSSNDPFAWWSFLAASLVVYGLAPRLLLWSVAQLGVRAELARAPRAHADQARLQERLTAPALDTRALAPEPSAAEDRAAPAAWAGAPAGPVHALCWSGVPLDDAALRAGLARGGAEPAGPIAHVGALDQAEDRRALDVLRAAARDGAAACLVLPAWEPPVGEYLDFLRGLRAALGDGRALWVLLFRLDAHAPDELEHWRRALAGLGDPWLRAAPWPGSTTSCARDGSLRAPERLP